MKIICLFIYYIFGTWLPSQPVPGWKLGYKLRRWLMKYIAEECGLNVVIKQNAYVGTGRGLRIGNNSQLGVNSRIGPFVWIGSDVVMGPDVVIMTTAHAFENPGEPIRLQGDLPVKSVKVGNDVWIGTRVIVMPGVTLGNGSVIGAGSVVTRDIPPLAIAAGNPARVFRKRGDRINTSS